MYFYIGDLHFNCVNQYEGRSLEHDKIIKENWNKRVTNGDTVHIVGDIGRIGNNSQNEYLCELISTLKGKKVLILGNHDKIDDYRLRQLFTEIVYYKEVKDNFGANKTVVLCHYPMLIWNGQHKGWIHLYAHTHVTEEDKVYQNSLHNLNKYFEEERLRGRTDCPPAYAFNVGCMLWDYTPVTLKEILERRLENERSESKE